MRGTLASVIFHNKSGIAKDSFSNQFVLVTNAVAATDPIPSGTLAAFDVILANFYNNVTATGAPLGAWLADGIDRAAAQEIKYYDITDRTLGTLNAKGNVVPPPHGSPFHTGTFTLTAPNNAAGLPAEVCSVLTLRGRNALLSPVEVADDADEGTAINRPRQRHTGRISLGPLTLAALATEGTDNQVRPATAFMDCALAAAEGLSDDLAGIAQPTAWCVWSRKDGILREIVSVEMDNAFDTQRRRGAQPTSRSTRVFAPTPNLVLAS